MILDGPKIYLVKRHDGKELHVRESPVQAQHDSLGYHEANDFEIETLSTASLLWWSPRIKADSNHEPYNERLQ